MSERAENEMEQIQKGLEDFLQRELQLYTIEEEEKQEKELNVIGSAEKRGNNTGNRKNTASGRTSEPKYQFYEEDWDSEPAVRGPVSRSQGGSSGSRNSRSGGPQNGSGSRDSRSGGSQSRSGSRDNRSGGSQNGSGSRDSRSGGSQNGSGGRDSRSGGRDSEDDSRQRGSGSRSGRQKDRPVSGQDADKGRKKKKSRLKRFLLAAAVIVLLLGVGLYQLVGVIYGKMNYWEVSSVTDAPMQKDGVVNILLIGNDSRENGEDGRSDAMILLSVSRKTKTIYMTSLLRDMYVEIPGHEGNRLNAAYSFGGPELLMETVEQNLDITVNRYVQVNFEAFASLVDAVNGVDLELTSEEIEYVNGYLVEYNMLTGRPQGTDNMDTAVSGMVHLNGPQALAYCRNRYLGTDFGRTERQRKVLTAVIHKLPAAVLTNARELVNGLMPNLTTNLTQGECFRLSLMAGKLLTYDIIPDSIPQPGTYKDATIRKMSVLEVDFEANKKFLREKVYGEKP